jgi:hypothetical protein
MHEEDGSEGQFPLFSFGFYLLFLLSFVRGGDYDTLSAQWDWKDIQIRELTGARQRGESYSARRLGEQASTIPSSRDQSTEHL